MQTVAHLASSAFPFQSHIKSWQTQALRLLLPLPKSEYELVNRLEPVHEPIHTGPSMARPLRPESPRVALGKLLDGTDVEGRAPRYLGPRSKIRRIQTHANGDVSGRARQRAESPVVPYDIHAADHPLRHGEAGPVVERERQARVTARVAVRAGKAGLRLRLPRVFDGGEDTPHHVREGEVDNVGRGLVAGRQDRDDEAVVGDQAEHVVVRAQVPGLGVVLDQALVPRHTVRAQDLPRPAEHETRRRRGRRGLHPPARRDGV